MRKLRYRSTVEVLTNFNDSSTNSGLNKTFYHGIAETAKI